MSFQNFYGQLVVPVTVATELSHPQYSAGNSGVA